MLDARTFQGRNAELSEACFSDIAVTMAWKRGQQLIYDALGISQVSLYRWRELFDTLGSVDRPPSPLLGRTRIITHAILDAVQAIYKDEPNTYYDKIQSWLAFRHDISISLSALQIPA